MNRELNKSKTCTCGCEKKINWIDPKPFLMGRVSNCVGHSECKECGVLQSHYSGDMEGALFFQKLMQDMENSNNPNVKKH